MPVYVRYIPPFMIMWGLSRILETRKKIFQDFKVSSYPVILFILFSAFYFWELAGILYSDDLKTGWNIFFSRMSLILFPFVLAIPGDKVLKNTKFLLKLFAGSTVVFIIFCFLYAFWRSVSFHDGAIVYNPHPQDGYWMSYYFGSFFAFKQHPSYLSMYVIISVFISFESLFDESIRKKLRVLWAVSGIFLLVSIYFLSSRFGILTVIILLPVYIIIKLKRMRKRFIAIISILIVVIGLLTIFRSNERVNIGLTAINNGSIKQKLIEDGRIIIWKSALKIIRNNLILGVGIGDVKNELVKEYVKIGDEELAAIKYNSHNQFLEILLENGIIGVLLFLAILGCLIVNAFSKHNLILGLFIIMMLIFFMFETVLYRLAGVTFFALFSFLLLHLSFKADDYYDKS